MLRGHGSEVRLLKCSNGVVPVELLGACSGCPSANLSAPQFCMGHDLGQIKRVKIINQKSDESKRKPVRIHGF